MKILIWVLCSLGFALASTIFTMSGLPLGGIVTGLLAFGAFALARYLCRQWDNRKTEGREDESSTSTAPSATDAEAALTSQPIEDPPAEQSSDSPEEVFYMEAANGMMVRVPASRLEAWQAEQDKIRRGEKPELTEAERRMKEAILDTVYGKQQEDAPINAPSEPASNQTDYKIPFIATAISAAVLAFIAIIAVISASNMYSESDMKASYSRAYNSGYEAGLSAGQESGYERGYSDGLDDGNIEGYCHGYQSAVSDYADSNTTTEFIHANLKHYLGDGQWDWDGFYDWILARRKYIFGK